MTYKETIAEGVTLYRGDCREILAGQAADHFITDPPYEAHMHDAKRGRKVYGAQRRIRIDGHANPPPVDFASIDGVREQVAPLMVEGCNGWLLAFCTPEGVAPWRDAIEAAGAKYKRACFWDKPDSAPQFNGQGPAMAVEAFVAAWCGSGHSRWNGGGRRNLFRHMTNQADRHGAHPTEKPVSLMSELVELFTNRGEVVCDPFMGSGTTGVACVKLGRQFVGIEIEQKYFDIACKRISDALKQQEGCGEYLGEDAGYPMYCAACARDRPKGPAQTPSSKPYACPVCSKRFRKEFAMEQHHRDVHEPPGARTRPLETPREQP